MTRKGKRFWRFLFSLMPGAGEMYMGFMKRGVSTMLVFLGIFCVSTVTNIAEGLVLLPVIWCYSFFTVLNLAELPEEEFYQQEDHYILLNTAELPRIADLERGKVKFIAAALVIVGAFVAMDSLWEMAWAMMPEWLWDLASPLHRGIPKVVIALLLIAFGVYLIRGKKKALDAMEQENTFPELPLSGAADVKDGTLGQEITENP